MSPLQGLIYFSRVTGPEASVSELIEYITSVQVANADGVSFQELCGESKVFTINGISNDCLFIYT